MVRCCWNRQYDRLNGMNDLNRKSFLGYLFLFLLTEVSGLYSQNYFSGTIVRDTRWSGDIYINGDVVVPQGVILSIVGGSRIFFKPQTDVTRSGRDPQRAELIVEGILLAKGTNRLNPIIFTSQSENPQMNDWYGIVLKNLYENSVLKNCVIEYGYKGITCYGSSPEITDCEIRFHHNSGLSCEVMAVPRVTGCSIIGNGFAGINCELGAAPVVSQCTITQNNYGVIIFDRSQPDLGHFPAQEGQSSGENRIINNFEFDIYNHSSNNIYAQNNIWNTTSADEIRLLIFDNRTNPSYGSVIFEPIFLREKKKRLLRRPFVTQWSQPFAPAPANDTVRQVQEAESLARAPQPQADTSSLLPAVDSSQIRPDTVTKTVPETVYVYKIPPGMEMQKKKPAVTLQEPVLESFLDSGKRVYLRRAVPKYPDIYKKTGYEGKVYIEVIVDRDGSIQNYRVLRSDDELFTEAAVQALKKFRYQPGTVNGHPVRFRIVELFRFLRSKKSEN